MQDVRGAVVVGVDGSADSDRAVDWAAMAASSYQVGLHIVYALPQSSVAAPLTPVEIGQHAEFAENLLARAQKRAEQNGRPTTTEIVNAYAVPALTSAAEDARLLVVGARGHSTVGGLLLGSVSQTVTRRAACPVVVVREQHDPRATRVVVGADGSEDSDKAIGVAFDIASHRGVPLVAVHVWEDMRRATGRSRRILDERVAAEERQVGECLRIWRKKYPHVSVTPVAVPGNPTRVLNDASKTAALLVVGSRGHGRLRQLTLGSVSETVLHHARCPVAVVR